MDYAYRRNLIPDPRFRHVDSISSQGVTVKTVDHENGNRYLQITYDGQHYDPYVQLADNITTVPGSYRLHFNVYAEGGTGYVRVFTRERETSGYDNPLGVSVSDRQNINQSSAPFDLKKVTIVRIVPPKVEGEPDAGGRLDRHPRQEHPIPEHLDQQWQVRDHRPCRPVHAGRLGEGARHVGGRRTGRPVVRVGHHATLARAASERGRA